MSKVNITDVAERAGVSIKTVSRVLNREPNVRADTRRRVEDAIAALAYTPNQYARRLAGSRTFVIGLLYDNPSSSYVVDIQRGALSACRGEHYDVLLHPCDFGDRGLPAEVDRLLAQSRVDGILLTPPLVDHERLLATLRRANARYVRIAPGDRDEVERSVFTNDRESSAGMTAHLLSLGHESIAFILGHPEHKAMADRYHGYVDALRAAGRPVDGRLVKQGFNTFDSGIACGIELLQQEDRPTAIFAANDEMAFAVIRVAHQQGLRVPDDLSVVGFDDIPLGRMALPALTTVRQPVEEMATRATELLLGQLRGAAEAGGGVMLESVIRLRESAAPPPGRQGAPRPQRTNRMLSR